MNATIKVGDREMTVAEAREVYKALHEVFGEKTGLRPLYRPIGYTLEDGLPSRNREGSSAKPWCDYGIHNGVAV